MNSGGIGNGSRPVGGAQNVRENPYANQQKKPFDVSWDQTSAHLRTTVSFRAVANIPVKDVSQLEIRILFNKQAFEKAKNVKIKDGVITGEWTVVPYNAGDFTAGGYHVEVKQSSSIGVTSTPLKIVRAGGAAGAAHGGVSSFG